MKLAHPPYNPKLPPMSTSSFPSDPTVNTSNVLGKSQEERMQLALAAIQGSGTKAKGDPNYSIRQVAKDFNVPRSSIARRLKGMLFCYCIFVT